MIIPVFDVMNNACVCGKSGNRSTYRKLESVYGADILDISSNLHNSGASVVYIADLDKIMGLGNNSRLISKVNNILPVLLDYGASSLDDVRLVDNVCSYHVLATESMKSISDFEEIFDKVPHDRLVVSIDIKDDEILVSNKSIILDDVIELVNRVKPIYTIVLNLSQVGTKRGNRSDVVDYIVSETPYTQHIIGGGLTNESISMYKSEGIDNFLVGTILHNGTLFEENLW